jgi:hypothetical protein
MSEELTLPPSLVKIKDPAPLHFLESHDPRIHIKLACTTEMINRSTNSLDIYIFVIYLQEKSAEQDMAGQSNGCSADGDIRFRSVLVSPPRSQATWKKFYIKPVCAWLIGV